MKLKRIVLDKNLVSENEFNRIKLSYALFRSIGNNIILELHFNDLKFYYTLKDLIEVSNEISHWLKFDIISC